MKRLYIRLFTLSLALMVFAADGFSQKSILFVGRGSFGDYQSDVDMFDSLTAWGYAPDFWNSNGEFDIGIDGDFNDLNYGNYQGMVINETVDSKAMARFGTTDDYPLPCVNMEGYAVATGNDRWAWLNDNGTDLLQTTNQGGTADDQILVIKDNSHYITQVFNISDEIPWSSATEATDIVEIGPVSIKEVNVDFSAKLGQMKSHAGQAEFWNLVTVDELGVANNKLVFWGVNHVGLDGFAEPATGSYGTPEFYTIVKRSLQWILDETGGGTNIEAPLADQMDLVAFPNPASERVTIRFKSTSSDPYTATMFNMAGQQVEMVTRTSVPGQNYLFLDAHKYPAGIYQMRIDLEGESAITKVVIQ
jgi:hypothetical protein